MKVDPAQHPVADPDCRYHRDPVAAGGNQVTENLPFLDDQVGPVAGQIEEVLPGHMAARAEPGAVENDGHNLLVIQGTAPYTRWVEVAGVSRRR